MRRKSRSLKSKLFFMAVITMEIATLIVILICFILFAFNGSFFMSTKTVDNQPLLIPTLPAAIQPNLPTPPAIVQPDLLTPTQSVFSEETTIKAFPSDIIQQVSATGGFGGGGVCFKGTYSEPTFDYAITETVELMEEISLVLCGLSPSETVMTTIYLPDGTTESYTQTVEETDQNFMEFKYIASLEQPVGPYRFIFQTSTGLLETTINVVRPTLPRFYIETKEPLLVLYNFQPYEKVRIFIYNELKLVAWQEFIVSENGALTVKNNYVREPSEWDNNYYPSGSFIAVGEKSGQVGNLMKGWGNNPYAGWVDGDIFCSNAPLPIPDFGPNKSAETISVNAFAISGDGKKINLPLGTRIIVTGNSDPHCENGIFWWSAKCSDINYDGLNCETEYDWFEIPEGIGNEYFLRAIP